MTPSWNRVSNSNISNKGRIWIICDPKKVQFVMNMMDTQQTHGKVRVSA